MILCEWDAPEGHPGQCCVHLYAFYPIDAFHLSFNFLCLLLLQCIYLSGQNIKETCVLTRQPPCCLCSRWEGEICRPVGGNILLYWTDQTSQGRKPSQMYSVSLCLPQFQNPVHRSLLMRVLHLHQIGEKISQTKPITLLVASLSRRMIKKLEDCA